MTLQGTRNPTFLDSIIAKFGYPSWVPEALTALLLGLTFVTQLYVTSYGDNLVTVGKANFNSAGYQVIVWLPVVCFASASILCALRKAHKTLLVMAFAVLAYGLMHGAQSLGLPSEYWAWGVVLALVCLLLPALSRLAWWFLALVYMDRPARTIGRFLFRWGGRQIDRANARVDAAQSA